MAAVRFNQETGSLPFYSFVTQNPLLERLKDAVLKVWRYLQIAFLSVKTQMVLFFSFRALEKYVPFSAQVENIYLWSLNLWSRANEACAADEAQRKFEALEVENRSLRNQISHLETQKSHFVAANQSLSRTSDALRFQVHNLATQQSNIANREAAVAQHRDILDAQLAQHKEQSQALQEQLTTARQALALLLLFQSQLSRHLTEAQQEVADLQILLKQKGEYRQILERIASHCDLRRPPSQPTEIDHDLDQLLPLLVQHLSQTHDALTRAKKFIPRDGSAAIALSSLDRHLTSLREMFGQRIPDLIKFHSQCNFALQTT